MEIFWNNYIDLVAEEPEKHGMDYVHTYLVIENQTVWHPLTYANQAVSCNICSLIFNFCRPIQFKIGL